MKMQIDIDKVTRLLNPGEVIMITSAYKEKVTITTCAWQMPLSKEPPLVAVALAKKHFSSELILKSKEFAINIPDWSLLDKLIYCGSISGRTVDKFKETNFTKEKAKFLKYTPK
ncbi:MAG: flavin reductase family protein, partial [Candidatus Aenigmatarchaeota archaeon]